MAERGQRVITYAEAIREAFVQSMERDERIIIIGEGVPDPNAIFGTTRGLQKRFGAERVLDMPLAENGMTGICIGAALGGLRPVLIHQRIDFALLSMDQIVNNAAKWRYMFNDQGSVPLVIRMLIGRGWGQGPQHAQSLHALFAHIPGLKVVMPATPSDAKGMMIAAIEDDDPVLFIEHRWLHGIRDHVPEQYGSVSLDRAVTLRQSKMVSEMCVTIAAFSHTVVDAVMAADILEQCGVAVTIIDMRSARPIDLEPVLASVKETGHLVVLDTGWASCGVSAEVVARSVERGFSMLKKAPVRITPPDHPIPTSHYLTTDCYPGAKAIVSAVFDLIDPRKTIDNINIVRDFLSDGPKDVPYKTFTGPF
ncbi:MAG: alpha-ketoacid dehydrogenase subunit beta [Magnetococcales bacterium]|nr:alpha-ketoacid dehydrogenase subunit beta [Magnetococcales bacterium]